MHRILAINPGSTSTKIAVYEDDDLVFEEVIRYRPEELTDY
jgi:butyrate kinase